MGGQIIFQIQNIVHMLVEGHAEDRHRVVLAEVGILEELGLDVLAGAGVVYGIREGRGGKEEGGGRRKEEEGRGEEEEGRGGMQRTDIRLFWLK
jgi:hypothetical protein